MTLGSTVSNRNEYQEYFLGGKDGRFVGLTSPSCTDCLEIWEPQPSGTLRACPGLYKDCFTFFSFTFWPDLPLPSLHLSSELGWYGLLREFAKLGHPSGNRQQTKAELASVEQTDARTLKKSRIRAVGSFRRFAIVYAPAYHFQSVDKLEIPFTYPNRIPRWCLTARSSYRLEAHHLPAAVKRTLDMCIWYSIYVANMY